MSEEEPKAPPTPRKRRFWRKKRWWCFFLLIAGLVWLDGPGWRWIGQRAAAHYLPDLGYEGSFNLSGRLTSGSIRITGLEVRSEGLVHHASIQGFELNYTLLRALKGEIDGAKLKGLRVELDLDQLPEKEEEEEERPPLDLPRVLADVRQQLIPLGIYLDDFAAVVRRGDEILFSMEPSSIHHDPGSADFSAELGEMKLPGDRRIPAQKALLTWDSDKIGVDQLTLLEEVAVRDLGVSLSETPDFSGDLLIGPASISVETNLDSAVLSMGDAPLTVPDIERIAGIELPVSGQLDGIDGTLTHLSGGLEEIDAQLKIRFADINYDDWASKSVELDLTLEGSAANANLKLMPFGSPLDLTVDAELDRANHFIPTSAKAEVSLAEMRRSLEGIRTRFIPSDDERPAPPDGTIQIKAETTFDGSMPKQVNATIGITPNDDALPLSLKAVWKPEDAIKGDLGLPGLDFSGAFDPAKLTYVGSANLREFSPNSLDSWLLPFGIKIPDGMTASLSWKGAGEIRDVTHRGKLEIESFSWQQGDPDINPVMKADGRAEYAWPESLTLDKLKAVHGDQEIVAHAVLADHVLTVDELSWTEAGTPLAVGSASIPVSGNPADWKAILLETRPITVELETPVLPLHKLHRFLPETIRFPESSTAQLDIKLSGTPAEPILDADVQIVGAALKSQDSIPPADISLMLSGRGQSLKLEGAIKVPTYPEASISAVTAWDPDQWAEDPETVAKAPLDAELKISNLNLAPFVSHLPSARKLTGEINADVLVSGTVSKPIPTAKITLTGGSLEWHKAATPDIDSARLQIDVSEEKVTIQNTQLEVAGGTLGLSGFISLKEFKPSEFDLKLVGKALPVLRNDSLIVRASTDLALKGPWEAAQLSGSIKIIDSLLFKDFEILPIGVPANQVSQPSMPSIDSATPEEKMAEIPEPFRNWGLNVDLETGNPFLIRGNLAGGEVYLDANIGGTVGKPRPTGGARLREVVAQLPFSSLKIDSGTVTFVPDRPFDPLLNIKGESTVRPYDIEIYIYGPVSNPKIQPTSNPPLPVTEITTLIATGTTTKGFENPNAAAARAAQLVIEEMRRGRIGAMRSFRPIFKLLDKVDFQVGEEDPYSSKTYNSVSFNLDENWLLNAGISEEGYTRAKVTYLFRFR